MLGVSYHSSGNSLVTGIRPPHSSDNRTRQCAKLGKDTKARRPIRNSSSSTRFDELLVQIEKLQAEYGLKLQDALGSSKAARDSLSAPADASKASLKQAGTLIEAEPMYELNYGKLVPELIEILLTIGRSLPRLAISSR